MATNNKGTTSHYASINNALRYTYTGTDRLAFSHDEINNTELNIQHANWLTMPITGKTV